MIISHCCDGKDDDDDDDDDDNDDNGGDCDSEPDWLTTEATQTGY